MEQHISPCKHCGCDEFISQPNSYDLYQVIDNKLEWIDSLSVEDESKLYCRECGEELLDATANLFSATAQ